jgi:hypothetical protein
MELMLYAKGISWIDDCRIPFVDGGWGERKNGSNGLKSDEYGHKKVNQIQNTQGRFPANLLVSDDMLNDGNVSKSIKSNRGGAIDSNSGTYSWNEGNTKNVEKYLCGFNDNGSNSRYYNIDKWFNNLIDV